MASSRKHQLSNADVLLLTRIEGGEHTFRPGTMPRAGEDFEALVQQLHSLRDRGLIRLAEGRIMQIQKGRYLGAGPCDLTRGWARCTGAGPPAGTTAVKR